MDGVLVIDKPQGLTSHDVVAAARRLLDESRIGHTGTLDPLATGVLPLAIGRATRLVRFLVSSDKDYDATIRFGVTTDSYDITGAETSRTDAVPSREQLTQALTRLTGDYLQTPPAYSAKKIQGRRAYQLARDEGHTVVLAAAPVHVARADLVEMSGGRARIALTCSAGFYVRSFAHALGELVGTGACLDALRRTRAGEFSLKTAMTLEGLGDPARVSSHLIPLGALLRGFPAVTITARGREDAAHGREIEAGEYEPAGGLPDPRSPIPDWIRLLDGGGALVGIATTGPRPGSLHPSVVLI